MNTNSAFKFPYSVTKHQRALELGTITCVPKDIGTADYFHLLTLTLGSNLAIPKKFNLKVNKGKLCQADGEQVARHLYACGCPTSQIREIIPISKNAAIKIRGEMVRSGLHVRGNGMPPLLSKLDLQKSIRLDLLLTLCAYTVECLGADDLQAVVSGVYVYFGICQSVGVNFGIDASILYRLYTLSRYEIAKCSQCGSIFVRDNEDNNKKMCWHCNSPNRRALTGKINGVINNR